MATGGLQNRRNLNTKFRVGSPGDNINVLPTLINYNVVMTENKGRYTKPELRERLKQKIMQGSKGGKSGEWS